MSDEKTSDCPDPKECGGACDEIARPMSFEVPIGSLAEQMAEPGKIEVFDEVQISAYEAGLQREIDQSREAQKTESLSIVSGSTRWGCGGCDCDDDESDVEAEARVAAAAEFLEALAEAPHGVAPLVKDRARAAAAALRWALDDEEPSPTGSIFQA